MSFKTVLCVALPQATGTAAGLSEILFVCLKVKVSDIALNGMPISELRSVTCRMGSHSVTCHLPQVNTPHLNPSQIGWYSIYLPQRDGRLS